MGGIHVPESHWCHPRRDVPDDDSSASCNRRQRSRGRDDREELAGGEVLVSLRARCEIRLSAFELDVSVQQGTAGGSTTIVQAGVVTCDGHWQHVEVPVAPSVGSFASGTSTVDVFLGAFDQAQGDLEGTDTELVRVRP